MHDAHEVVGSTPSTPTRSEQGVCGGGGAPKGLKTAVDAKMDAIFLGRASSLGCQYTSLLQQVLLLSAVCGPRW